jgi:prolyl oligopeptidase
MRLALILATWLGIGVAQAQAQPAADPFLWLEQVQSARALDWVRAEDARSLKILQADPHYQTFYSQALALAQSSDRIPTPDFTAGQITNLWQDATHVQGIWRRTSLASYRMPAPTWATVLDLDALSKAEHSTWVWKGDTCFHPADHRCLISLSNGGEDAVTTREFDFAKAQFVHGGFLIPHAKQVADWETPDSILVGTDWGPGSMTASGYPFIIKRLHRGQALAQAQEVFRGTPQDVAVQVQTLTDAQGHVVPILQRGIDFFRTEFRVVTPTTTIKLPLPEKAEIEGLVDNLLIVKLNQDFTPAGGHPKKAGTLVALDMAHLDRPPTTVFVPNAAQAVDEVATTAHTVVATILDRVRGRALVFTPAATGWSTRTIDLPDNAAVSLVATNDVNDEAFLDVTSFLVPTSLYLVDAAAATPPVVIKSLPPKFDASGEVTEQFEATSTDGTKIPYFVVHPKGMKLDGKNPTLLYAYGGFQVSMTPKYSATLGKLWLERGGVYVLANIRGGGEFGPAWHEAGLKTKRQIIYDDFASVAKDLIARHITSPVELGIRGGSNGGLLMGVEFEQHPDLWHAVIIEVPLLDMLRFEKIAAGASWVGEYGSVSNPAQRAFLAKISPYANLKAGVAYPEPFIFTTTKDDRVGPVHARKFAAKMEAMKLPFLYYEALEGGHAAGANLKEAAQEQALEMTYLTEKLNKK